MTSGKSAVITGSTSGIGRGIAEGFAASGMNVMLNGLEGPDEIEEYCDRLRAAHGVRVAYRALNVARPGEASALIDAALTELGAVDILVNNAGIQHVAPIESFPDEKWDAIIALNLSAAFYTTKAALPDMQARGWGRIINIASAHGLVASPYKAAYVAAKHGMLGLTKTAALEVATQGITVNAISPGYVWTPLVEAQVPDTAQARGMSEEEVKRDIILAAQPTRKFVTIEEIAALALFLCGDAALSITGTSLSVDGGWTAQ